MDDNYDDFTDPMFDGMSEVEKIEEEERMLDMAFNNSYRIITSKITFSDLIELSASENSNYTAVAHNIDDGPTDSDLENIIIYFQEKEEYEKCAVLHKMLTA